MLDPIETLLLWFVAFTSNFVSWVRFSVQMLLYVLVRPRHGNKWTPAIPSHGSTAVLSWTCSSGCGYLVVLLMIMVTALRSNQLVCLEDSCGCDQWDKEPVRETLPSWLLRRDHEVFAAGMICATLTPRRCFLGRVALKRYWSVGLLIFQSHHWPGVPVGTTTPSPNGLIAEIIDDEMATMNWAPGKITSFWRVQIVKLFFVFFSYICEVKNPFGFLLVLGFY